MTETSLSRRCRACGYRYETTLEVCPLDGATLGPARPEAAMVGPYRLLQRLGDGGMGVVYRADHTKLGRSVAIKLLHKSFVNDRDIVSRFFHEARAVNTIRHQNVVDIYDFVETADDVYLVMELLRGQDLHDGIHKGRPGPMSPERAVHIMEQTAAALHATHQRNIIHRDMKPENVFLCERNNLKDFVKVLDFGIAKLERPEGRMTVDGAVVGTPEYMAPEQARGEEIDGRADIYSLGCLGYEMLTARQIFAGGGYSDVVLRQINTAPPPIRQFVPGVPPALEAAVLRALAKSPDARPRDAQEFAAELAGAMGHTLDSEPFGAWRTLTPVVALRGPTPDLRSRRRTARSAARRHALGRVAIGCGLLALGVALGFTLRRAPPAAPPAAVPRAETPSAAQTPLVYVLLQTLPTGAEVLDERGNVLGETPHGINVRRGEERLVRFRKTGYKDAERSFTAPADTTLAVTLEPASPAERSRGGGGRAAGARAAPGGARAPLDSTPRTIDHLSR